MPNYLEINGQRYSYFDFGNPFAENIIIYIHGYGGSGCEAKYLSPLLGDDYRIVALDYPGSGFSEKPEDPNVYSCKNFSNLTARFLNTLGIEKAIVLGHSLGGRISVHFVKDHPNLVSHLILIAPYLFEGEEGGFYSFLSNLHPLVDLSMNMNNPVFFRATLRINVFNDPSTIPEEYVHYIEKSLFEDNGKKGLALVTKHLIKDAYVDKLLGEIPFEILLFWGKNDRLMNISWADKVLALKPETAFMSIDNCGHMPHIEKPWEIAHTIQDYIKES